MRRLKLEATSDPGLFGPGSVSWRIDREAIILAGGTCALLMQLAHPAIAAGVAQHSDFESNPFSRLRRTLTTTYAVVFGTTARAERAFSRMNAIHRSVFGEVPETGEAYRALDPDLLLWVHATLVDTAVRVYDRYVAPLSVAEADAYHREARVIATRLGVPEDRMPGSLADLRVWMAQQMADGTVRVTPTARSLAPSVLHPTRIPPRLVWEAGHLISFSVMPAHIRRGYGIRWSHARERGMQHVAAVSRRILPALPAPLREVPHVRSAERRLGIEGRLVTPSPP